LPKQTLSADLSQRVLQEAKRRQLEARPADVQDLPTLPHRTFRERFLSGRNLAWLSLTVGLAVLISLNEKWQKPQQMAHQIAQNPAPEGQVFDRTVASRPGPPPTMQAPADAEDRKKVVLEEKAVAGRSKRLTKAKAAPVRDDVTVSPRRSVADKPALQYEPEAAPGSAPAAMPSSPMLEQKQNLAARTQGDSSSKIGAAESSVVVVRCRISKDAAEQHSLEKLLAAHGITWQDAEQRGRGGRAMPQEKATKMAEAAKEQNALAASADVASIETTTGPTTYETNATPDQLTAVLAEFAAKPKVFAAVSVQRVPSAAELNLGQALAANRENAQKKDADKGFEFTQQVEVGGDMLNVGPSGELKMEVRNLQNAAAKDEKPQAAAKSVGKKAASQQGPRVVFVVELDAAPPAKK
jgi:hypothetical protein